MTILSLIFYLESFRRSVGPNGDLSSPLGQREGVARCIQCQTLILNYSQEHFYIVKYLVFLSYTFNIINFHSTHRASPVTIPTEDFAKLQIPSVGLHLIKEDTVTYFVLFGKWLYLFFLYSWHGRTGTLAHH